MHRLTPPMPETRPPRHFRNRRTDCDRIVMARVVIEDNLEIDWGETSGVGLVVALRCGLGACAVTLNLRMPGSVTTSKPA